jgi:hypothetical protein
MIAIVAAVRIVHRHKVLLAPPFIQTPLSRKSEVKGASPLPTTMSDLQ